MTAKKTTTVKSSVCEKKETLKEVSKELIDLFVKLVEADCPQEAKGILETLEEILDSMEYL